MVNIFPGQVLKQEFLKDQFLVLFFFIFINDLSDNLVWNPELFADDILSAKNLNDDLKKINKWAFQWKMSFNPDPNKQAQEVIFSRKLNTPNHPSLNYNNTVVIQSTTHKHLGVISDTKLDFQEYLKERRSVRQLDYEESYKKY